MSCSTVVVLSDLLFNFVREGTRPRSLMMIPGSVHVLVRRRHVPIIRPPRGS